MSFSSWRLCFRETQVVSAVAINVKPKYSAIQGDIIYLLPEGIQLENVIENKVSLMSGQENI